MVDGRPVDDPATRAAVVRASQSVSALPARRRRRRTPTPPAILRLRATDGDASLIVITLDETTNMATIKDDVTQVRKTLRRRGPGRDA